MGGRYADSGLVVELDPPQLAMWNRKYTDHVEITHVAPAAPRNLTVTLSPGPVGARLAQL